MFVVGVVLKTKFESMFRFVEGFVGGGGGVLSFLRLKKSIAFFFVFM